MSLQTLHSRLKPIHAGCKATRSRLGKEIDTALAEDRRTAPDFFKEKGWPEAIPYLDRFFDGLRENILSGQDRATILLVNTMEDDVDSETTGNLPLAFMAYLRKLGLGGTVVQAADRARGGISTTLFLTF